MTHMVRMDHKFLTLSQAKTILISIFLLFFCLPSMVGQQTTKSKSKEKIYEKSGENKNVRIRNAVTINSAGDEFSPSFYKGGIVFVASKGKHGPKSSTSQVFTDMYYAQLDPNMEPIGYSKFSHEMNSRKNEGAATFSRNWNSMYFSQNNIIDGVEQPGHDRKLHIKIFEAKRGTLDWMQKRALPFNSDQFSCMHPSLSADDRTLYFASNMPGGFGGFDLYKSELSNGSWSTPVNLGGQINTSKNDVFPFIFPSGDLYFASAGQTGLGGYDLFRVNIALGTDSVDIINLGQPFNSESDDFGLILSDDGKRGYFSSNRSGGMGSDDIYSFVIETSMPGMEKIESKQKVIVVTDQFNQPIKGAELRVLGMSEGAFLSASKDLYRTRVEPIDPNSNELHIKLIKLKEEELGPPDAFTNAHGEAIFDFSPYTDYLIVASNDSMTAETSYRVQANDTDDHLFIQLIKPSTKMLRGQLLNQSGNRLNNARLRFTNDDTSVQDHSTTDSDGKFAIDLEKGTYKLRISKDGFKDEYMQIEFDPASSDFREFRLSHRTEPADRLPITEALKPGYVMTSDKIEYELNSDRLDPKAQITLKSMIMLLVEHPEMEIEIRSHTDAQGGAKENQLLSQRRADKAKEFILASKYQIAPNRIKAVGKGETEIKNHCKDGVTCDDTEHAVNRRTEFAVLKI
jgi:outer membrane protein OmpA-like peptidoglycan-associated protein